MEERRFLAPIASGDEIIETIPSGAERDYEIVLAAGERVVIRAGITSGSGEVDLRIFNPASVDITNNFLFPSTRIHTAFTAETAGEYTLRVGDEDRNESLPYRMRVVALPGLETTLPGRDVTPTNGQSFTASLAEHSFNVHTVNLTAGDWVRVSGRNSSPNFPEENSVIDIEVYDPTGVRVASVNLFLQSLDFSAEMSGEYTIIVYDEENLYDLDYELRYVSLPGNPVVEPGSDGDLMTGQILTLEAPEGGFGVNQFSAPAAGETYRVHAAKRTGGGSTEVAVIGPDGSVVLSDFDFPGAGGDFTTTSPGPHWVVVWDDTNNDRMEYVIRLGKLSGAPLPFVENYDAPLTLGQEYFAENGLFYPLFNLHPLMLEAGQTVNLALYDVPGSFSTPLPELTVYAPDGVLLASEASFDRVEASFTAGVPGVYTVVASERGNDSPMRSYRLSAEEAAPPIVGDYNGDQVVDRGDFLVWQSAFGSTAGPPLAADGNGDGKVDAIDYAVWRENFIPPIQGDYNDDGQVDSSDYSAWQSSYGLTGPNLPTDGNKDGAVDAIDYAIWRENLVAAPSSNLSSEDADDVTAKDASFAVFFSEPTSTDAGSTNILTPKLRQADSSTVAREQTLLLLAIGAETPSNSAADENLEGQNLSEEAFADVEGGILFSDLGALPTPEA